MNIIIKSVVLVTVFVLMLIGDLRFTPTLNVGLFSDAHAIAGVRRRTARRTAVVIGSSAASANAAATATAQQQAATAQQQTATAQQQAATAEQQSAAASDTVPPSPADASKALPLGTVVASLPTGCTSAPVDGVEYYDCGANKYRAVFQGNSLVYVTAQP